MKSSAPLSPIHNSPEKRKLKKKIPPKAYKILIGKPDKQVKFDQNPEVITTPFKNEEFFGKRVDSPTQTHSAKKKPTFFLNLFECKSESNDSNFEEVTSPKRKQQNLHATTLKKNYILSQRAGNEEVSFKETMKSGSNRKHFKNFCKNEMNVENVDFWEQVQYKYKKLKNKNQRLILAETLFSTYIEPKSLFALNINKKSVDEIKERIDDAKENEFNDDKLVDLFSRLQKEIERVMVDAYARFKDSKEYREMMNERKERESQFEEKLQTVRRGSCRF